MGWAAAFGASPPVTERRFTEEEFTRILRAATELQARALPRGGSDDAGGADREPGMTLREIQDIATEVGLDPEVVARAAGVVQREESLSGSPHAARFTLTDVVPGTLSEGDRIRVLKAVRSATGLHGDTTPAGEGVEWSVPSGELNRFSLSVYPLEGQKEIQLSADLAGTAVLSHILPSVAGLFLGAITASALDPVSGVVTASLVGGGAAAGLTTARLIWRRTSRKARERARRILAEVRSVLAADVDH